MRISEFIKNLQEKKDKYGDLLVTVYDDESDIYSLDVTTAIVEKSKSKVMAFDEDIDNTFLSILDDCYLC